jgi:hypothetical protein
VDNDRNSPGTQSAANNGSEIALSRPLRMLTAEQIQRIDDALFELGPFSEVRIIKAKGRVRFIQCVESFDASS